MQWTKIPTNILINRMSDQEIVAIVKYQLLWADLEYQPSDKTALRYMTNKQLSIVKQYLNTIETQVKRDIHSSASNRKAVKLNYLKNNKKTENLSISLTDSLSGSLEEQIRLDKNIYIDSEQGNSSTEPKKKTKRYIPEDWKPKQDTIAKLTAKGYDAGMVIDQFVNTCRAKGYKYIDFDRAVFCWHWDDSYKARTKSKLDDDLRARL